MNKQAQTSSGHFADCKTVPRFTAPPNTEKIMQYDSSISNVLFWGPKQTQGQRLSHGRISVVSPWRYRREKGEGVIGTDT